MNEIPDNIRIVPLSYSQQQMWIIDQIQPGNHAYNMPVAFQLKGYLDVSALENSFNEIVKRHETLRTTLQLVENQPRQLIYPEYLIKIRTINLESVSSVKLEEEVKDLIIKEVSRPFNLSELPLIRVTLLKLSEEENILVLNLHHIISDGWSLGIIFHELAAFYNNYLTGHLLDLPDLPITYSDYVNWQHQKNWSPSYEEQLKYWTVQLGGDLPILELPMDYRRPLVQSPDGSNEFFFLSGNLAQKIQSTGIKRGCTFFMTILAAFQVFLSKYSGMEDIIIGTPVSNRPRNSDQNLIGNFLNIVALRSDLSDNPDFNTLLQRTQKTTIEALKNRDLPFEQIVEHLKIERDLSRNPVFQVMLQVLPKYSFELFNLQTSNLNFDHGYSQFDLSLHLYQVEEGYNCRIEYDTDLFEKNTIKRMVWNFQYFLNEITEKTTKKISEISILNPEEEKRVIFEWNDTKSDYFDGNTIKDLFEKQVAKTPDAIAVEMENKNLIYRELEEQSNRVANYLRKKGVDSEIPVAICMERSLELIVGLLGILKAGGAYVPIDPGYPKERIDYMLEDCGAKLLLSQGRIQKQLTSFPGTIILIDDFENQFKTESNSSPRVEISRDNMAYIIYTSGSTGRPKGTINTQGGITNYLKSLQAFYNLSLCDIALHKTPISFDVSVREIFLPLCTGAKLILARHEGHKDSSYLVEIIKSKEITFLSFVPSQLNSILMENEIKNCRSIRQVVCSGEVLSPALANSFFDKISAELDNLYGPTEAAVDVTRWKCIRDQNMTNLPIGKPIPNNKIYILDKYNRPVPIGVIGEICIGGIQVARGYLNQDNLTKEKFIPDSFSSEPESRIYKTGDLGRFVSNGNIEYFGRKDNQVKIRGFRIELEEIETILESKSEIQKALVITRKYNNGNIRLIAYLIPSKDKTLDVNQIKSYLAEKLPDYMIPSFFIVMEKFPLTPNEKVDRNALPEPERDNTEISESFVESRDEIEENLTRIWEEILNFKPIGINDDYFDIGGNSLLLMSLKARILELWGVSIPVITLFTETTVKKQSLLIKLLMQKSDVEITGNSDDREVFEL